MQHTLPRSSAPIAPSRCRSTIIAAALTTMAAAAASPAVAEPASPAVTAPANSSTWSVAPTAQLRDRLVVDSARDFVERTGPGHRHYVTQRARAGLTAVHPWHDLTLRIVGQDVRVWGEEADPTAFSAKGLDVYEAYAGVKLAPAVTLTLGRQGLSWDNERLIGKLDWAQRARAMDAIRLDLHYGNLAVQGFVAHLQNDTAQAEADGHVTAAPGTERTLTGLHAGWQLGTDWKAALLYLFRSTEATKESRHTAGAFVTGKALAGAVSLTAEAYAQVGKLDTESIAAWMGAIRVGYKTALPGSPGLQLFGEALSGDRTKQGAFDTLYGTNHRYYGEMDIFLDIPKHTALHGLVDAGATLHATPQPWLATSVDWHVLRTAVQQLAAGSNSLGHEIDCKVTATLHKNLYVQAVYGVFVADDALQAIKSIAPAKLANEQMLFVTVDASF